MANQVEVKFTAWASKDRPPYVDAKPGDVKKIDAEWVNDDLLPIAQPTKKEK